MLTEPKITISADQHPFLAYSDDDAASPSNKYYGHRQSRSDRALSHVVAVTITSLLWLLVFFLFSPPSASPSHALRPSSQPYNITTGATLLSCGSTTAAARAVDCRFDVLLNAWVPAPCYDEDYIADYLDDGSSAAFADEALTILLAGEEEMLARGTYWTSRRDHMNHCAVLWNKQFRALFEEREAFDTIVASGGHTDHCAAFLKEGGGMDGMGQSTKVDVGYAGCWVRG